MVKNKLNLFQYKILQEYMKEDLHVKYEGYTTIDLKGNKNWRTTGGIFSEGDYHKKYNINLTGDNLTTIKIDDTAVLIGNIFDINEKKNEKYIMNASYDTLTQELNNTGETISDNKLGYTKEIQQTNFEEVKKENPKLTMKFLKLIQKKALMEFFKKDIDIDFSNLNNINWNKINEELSKLSELKGNELNDENIKDYIFKDYDLNGKDPLEIKSKIAKEAIDYLHTYFFSELINKIKETMGNNIYEKSWMGKPKTYRYCYENCAKWEKKMYKNQKKRMGEYLSIIKKYPGEFNKGQVIMQVIYPNEDWIFVNDDMTDKTDTKNGGRRKRRTRRRLRKYCKKSMKKSRKSRKSRGRKRKSRCRTRRRK